MSATRLDSTPSEDQGPSIGNRDSSPDQSQYINLLSRLSACPFWLCLVLCEHLTKQILKVVKVRGYRDEFDDHHDDDDAKVFQLPIQLWPRLDFTFATPAPAVFRWKTWPRLQPDPDPDPEPELDPRPKGPCSFCDASSTSLLRVWLRFYWVNKRSKHFEVAPRIECFIGLSAWPVRLKFSASQSQSPSWSSSLFMRSVNISDYAPTRLIIANDNTNWKCRELEGGIRFRQDREILCYACFLGSTNIFVFCIPYCNRRHFVQLIGIRGRIPDRALIARILSQFPKSRKQLH